MLDSLAPFAFVLLWSSSFVSTRAALNHVSPLTFITLRLALCALVLLAITVATRRRFAPLAGKWWHCAVAGALINGLMLASSHWGIVRTGAAPLALVQTLTPILTALLGGPLLGEWLRLRQWLGLVLGAAGVGLVVGIAAIGNTTQFDGLIVGAGGVLALTAGTLYYARFCRDAAPSRHDNSIHQRQRCLRRLDPPVRDAPRYMDRDGGCRALVECRPCVVWWDGALFPDADPRHGGPHDIQFLSRARRHCPYGVAVSRRGALIPGCRRPRHRVARILFGVMAAPHQHGGGSTCGRRWQARFSSSASATGTIRRTA